MREASIQSRRSGEKNISAKSVRKVTEVRTAPSPVPFSGIQEPNTGFQGTLRKFRG